VTDFDSNDFEPIDFEGEQQGFSDFPSLVRVISLTPDTSTPEWNIKLYRIVNDVETSISFDTGGVEELETEQIMNEEVGNFRVRLTNETGQDVMTADAIEIYLKHEDDPAFTKVFTGQVIKAPEEVTDEGDKFMDVTGNDWGILLKRHKFTRTFSQTTFADVIKDIVAPITKAGTPTPTENKISVNNVGGTELIDWEFNNVYYWDAIQELCKKYGYCFYVDEDKDLNVFKEGSRYSLKALQEEWLEKYKYYTTIEYIINYQEVWGRRSTTFFPETRDIWTETTSNWTALGWNYASQSKPVTLSLGTPGQAGVYYVRASTTDTIQTALIRYNIPTSADCSNTYSFFNIWRKQTQPWLYKVRLETDTSNYFETDQWLYDPNWNLRTWSTNTSSGWTSTGSPDWGDINSVAFNLKYPVALFNTARFNLTRFDTFDVLLSEQFDDMYFEGTRVMAISYDVNSQNTYGLSEGADIIDESLVYNSQAQAVADYMVSKYKDPLPVVEGAEVEYNDLTLRPGELIDIIVPEITDEFLIIRIRHIIYPEKNVDQFILSYFVPGVEEEMKSLKSRVHSLEYRIED